MRRVSAIVLAVAVAGASASVSSAGVASAHQARAPVHQDFPPRPGATPIVIGLPNLNPPTATPGPAHSSPPSSKPSTPTKPNKPPAPPDAVRMALGNGYVRALLHGKAYRVKKVGPWPAGQGKTVQFAFYHPATIAGTWLAAGKGPYKATYRNVKSIRVYVNMRRAQVMATVPYPRIRV